MTLRALTRDDMETVWRFGNDVEVELLGGGSPPRPQTLPEFQEWFEEHVVKAKGKEVQFAMEADGKMIGWCGLWRFDWTHRTCWLGISIGERDYWSHGYGRETIGLLLDYAFRLRNIRKVCLTTSSNNERAIRCYRACGFVEEGRLRAQLWCDGRYVDEVYMGVIHEER